MTRESTCDLLVIGSGPGGQKAAIQAAKAGFRATIVERERGLGGACVYRGTIPSKALREGALRMARSRRAGDPFRPDLGDSVSIPALMGRVESVIEGHDAYITDQLARNGVTRVHGRARFVSSEALEVTHVNGEKSSWSAPKIVVATGSRPRNPEDVPIDHEQILDSDSILSLVYLPASLTILGAGVIACEYATIFAVLGVRVTLIDRGPRPLAFLDADLTDHFLESFAALGGRWIGERKLAHVEWDGLSQTVVTLDDGTVVEGEKALVTLGRVANLEGLDIGNAGLVASPRGLLEVDAHCRTANPAIYAVGDVIGPPALAATSMEQGRRAACHALGIEVPAGWEVIPSGIYTIPELSTVGLGERQAVERYGAAVVGRARFDEVARGCISGVEGGMLKLVADPEGRRLVGAAIVGDGATELIHIAQMALLAGFEIDALVENVFNFPTLAEAYRIAALDVVRRRPAPVREQQP